MRWSGQLQLKNVRPLGQGGHGQVYAATLECGGGIAESVVLKIPHAGADHREYLLEEARLVAKLRHPHIIGFRDFNEVVDDAGVRVPCLILEHGGIALSDLLRAHGGRLEPGLAAFIAVGVLSGLAHAHAHGTIHRDIKPSNVVIGARGEVRLIDFGIAKAADNPNPTTDLGVLKGTTLYVSPEAYLGKKLDGRADLWSVGILLYEMLIGRYPWYINRADCPNDLMYASRVAQAVESAPLPDLPEELVPPQLAEIVQRLTRKSREFRYESAAEAIGALERVVSTFISPWAAARELGQQVTSALRASSSGGRPPAPDAATFDIHNPPHTEPLPAAPPPMLGGVEIPSELLDSHVTGASGRVDALGVTEQVSMPVAPRPRRRVWIGPGLVAASLLLAAGLMRRSAGTARDDTQGGQVAQPSAQPLTLTEARAPAQAHEPTPTSPGEPALPGVEAESPAAEPGEVAAPPPADSVRVAPRRGLEAEAQRPRDARASAERPLPSPSSVGAPGVAAAAPPARAQGGAIDVVVEPRGAYVSLDGQPPVQAPIKLEGLSAGAHVLRFGLAAGALNHERRVRVRPGRVMPVQVKLLNPFDEQG
jgi:eukaryotic-like serine/threonine-protein kinase